jgi:hypothetical protein
MLVLNCWPLLHLALVAVAAAHRWELAALVLYGLPPLCARLLLASCGRPQGRFRTDQTAFLVWWSLASLQTLFLRFPFLEEALRLVPGLYSAWLRAWGARVGSFVFWAPGTTILDRSFVDIGDRVVFGMGVRLNPHVLAQTEAGPELTLATVQIGRGALVGGYSLLLAGSSVAPGEQPLGNTILPPYSRFENGQRVRPHSP